MKLEDFGYNEWVEKRRVENNLKDFDLGRVVAEHKERYTVITEKGEYDAEITGNLRFSASGRGDFPAVGDWVALTLYEPDFAVIHAIIPRFSLLTRQAPDGNRFHQSKYRQRPAHYQSQGADPSGRRRNPH